MAMSGSSAKRLEAMILQMKLCIEEFAACAVSVGFQLLCLGLRARHPRCARRGVVEPRNGSLGGAPLSFGPGGTHKLCGHCRRGGALRFRVWRGVKSRVLNLAELGNHDLHPGPPGGRRRASRGGSAAE